MQSELITCRHVAINLGAQAETIKEMLNTPEPHPLSALLDPEERAKVEVGEDSL